MHDRTLLFKSWIGKLTIVLKWLEAGVLEQMRSCGRLASLKRHATIN